MISLLYWVWSNIKQSVLMAMPSKPSSGPGVRRPWSQLQLWLKLSVVFIHLCLSFLSAQWREKERDWVRSGALNLESMAGLQDIYEPPAIIWKHIYACFSLKMICSFQQFQPLDLSGNVSFEFWANITLFYQLQVVCGFPWEISDFYSVLHEVRKTLSRKKRVFFIFS